MQSETEDKHLFSLLCKQCGFQNLFSQAVFVWQISNDVCKWIES